MRLTHERFTVRRLMVAVALVAVLLGGVSRAVRLRRLSDSYARRALNWDYRRDFYEGGIWNLRYGKYADGESGLARSGRFAHPAPAVRAELIHRLRGVAAYCDELRRKYEGASARPWRPVGPDPPAPLIDERMRAVAFGDDAFRTPDRPAFGTSEP
jgi:hypothetical protein